MTNIHTIESCKKVIEVVDIQFVNLYELLQKFKERLIDYHNGGPKIDVLKHQPSYAHNLVIPESLKYHDLCIGTLNTGYVFIGESCPARIEEYNREMAHKLSEKSMMDQVFAMRSYLIKEERSGNVMAEFVSSYKHARSGYTFNLPFEIREWYLPLYQLLDFPKDTLPVVLAIGVLPNSYTLIGMSQSIDNVEYYHRYTDLCGDAMLQVYMKTQELYRKHYLIQKFNK